MSNAMASRLTPLENELWKKLKGARDSTLSATDLQRGLTPQAALGALNGLMSKSLIITKQNEKGEPFFMAVNKDEAKKTGALDQNEQIAYNCIKSAGNMGIWIRSIKTETNLPQTVLMKVMRSLEKRDLVKTIKSIKAPTKKLYMCVGMTPSAELTGGPFYDGHNIDVGLISDLSSVALRFVQEKSFPRKIPKRSNIPDEIYVPNPIYAPSHTSKLPGPQAILTYFEKHDICKIKLGVEHIIQIMSMLVYEGKVEIIKPIKKMHEEGWNSDLEQDGGAADEDEVARIKAERAKVGKKRPRPVDKDSDAESDVDSDSDSESGGERDRKRRKKDKEKEREKSKDKKRKEKEREKEKKQKKKMAKLKKELKKTKKLERERKKKEKEKERKRKRKEKEKAKKKSKGKGDDSDVDMDGNDSDELVSVKDTDKKKKRKKKSSSSSSESDSDSSSDSSSSSSDSDSSDSDSDSDSDSSSGSSSDSSNSSSSSSKEKNKRKAKSELPPGSYLDGSDPLVNLADGMGGRFNFHDNYDPFLDKDVVYRAVRTSNFNWPVNEAPCGLCPIQGFCSESGPVNPIGCEYYGNWDPNDSFKLKLDMQGLLEI